MRTVKEVTAVAVAMGCGPQRSLPAAVSPIASGASGPAGNTDRHVLACNRACAVTFFLPLQA